MKSRINRICIYPKDIQRITGKSERYSRDLIHKIKKANEKPEHQMVSIEELSAYIGLPPEKVREFITD